MEKHEMFEDDYHHYAYDDNGKLVHLCIDEEPIPREKYRCIACERDVYPVEGEKKKRDWHFRHTIVNPNCNTESYLHQLAKKLIKEKFDNSETFNILYHVKEVCSYYEKCKEHFDYCEKTRLETFNLKEEYDTCIPEKKDSHLTYLPDLKLSSKNNPKRKPLFIEIAYTHDCTEDKINSGIKIVELKIYVEEDILQPLVENSVMIDYTSGNPYQFTDMPKVRFFNFDRVIKNKGLIKKCGKEQVFRAKKKLIKDFAKSDHFFVQYNCIKQCSDAAKCPLACQECNKKDIIEEDFKQIYNSCEEGNEDNLVFKNVDEEVPSTKIKLSFDGRGKYNNEGRVIELLHYNDIKKKLTEGPEIDEFPNPQNPYRSIFAPSIRFYNFERFVNGENTIKLARFAIIKEGGELYYTLLDDTDCRHIDSWPTNVIYGVLVPKTKAVKMGDFKSYGMMKACLNGFKIYHCSLCKFCHKGEGGCVHMGYYMCDLLPNDNVDKEKESKKCVKYSINLDLIKHNIGEREVPHIEWNIR